MATKQYLFLLLLIIMLTTAWGDSKPASAERQVQMRGVAQSSFETAEAMIPTKTKDMSRSAIKPPFDKADINWRRFDGATINALLSGHPHLGNYHRLSA
jgi:hypothetical protein